MKFSVTVPAYKAGFLRECIKSVLAQTWRDFELIIVNDASPEDLDSIVRSFDDPRIRYYVNEKNCGAVNVVDNWNRCLEYARGEYIICMGDDDRLRPRCLEEYAELMEKYPGLDIYHAWTVIIDENSEPSGIQAPRPEYESVYSLIWNRWTCRNQQYIGDFLFRTASLREKGGFYKLPLAWASDDISAVMMAAGKGIANTQSVCFEYRVNRQTISSTGNGEIKIEAIIRERSWYADFVRECQPRSETDRIYFGLIEKEMGRHFDKKLGSYIGRAMAAGHPLSVIRSMWRKRKPYGLNGFVFKYAMLEFLKHRKKRHPQK